MLATSAEVLAAIETYREVRESARVAGYGGIVAPSIHEAAQRFALDRLSTEIQTQIYEDALAFERGANILVR